MCWCSRWPFVVVVVVFVLVVEMLHYQRLISMFMLGKGQSRFATATVTAGAFLEEAAA